MFRRRLFAMCAVAVLVCGSTALAQDAAKKAAKAPAATPAMTDPKAMQEAMEKYCTPGAEHQTLAKLEGKWTTSSKMWMDPTQPPTTSEGTAEFTMVLGGRFLQQKYSSTMMGQPFEGLGLIGYDRFTQRYVSTWADNMGTVEINAAGTATGDVISMSGTTDEPMTGVRNQKFREVIKMTGPDTFTFEWWTTTAGKETKMLEIAHTRNKM